MNAWSFFAALVWPIALVVAVLLLRAPLRDLLTNLAKLTVKTPGVEVTMARVEQKVDDGAARVTGELERLRQDVVTLQRLNSALSGGLDPDHAAAIHRAVPGGTDVLAPPS